MPAARPLSSRRLSAASAREIGSLSFLLLPNLATRTEFAYNPAAQSCSRRSFAAAITRKAARRKPAENGRQSPLPGPRTEGFEHESEHSGLPPGLAGVAAWLTAAPGLADADLDDLARPYAGRSMRSTSAAVGERFERLLPTGGRVGPPAAAAASERSGPRTRTRIGGRSRFFIGERLASPPAVLNNDYTMNDGDPLRTIFQRYPQ